MIFWIFMLIMDLLIPVIMFGFGRYFIKTAPKEINLLFGYRTSMSMKNKDTWEFAHKHIGKLWFVWGLILLPLSIIPLLFFIGKDENIVGTVGCIITFVQLILLIGTIFPTERALKRNFDSDGNKKL